MPNKWHQHYLDSFLCQFSFNNSQENKMFTYIVQSLCGFVTYNDQYKTSLYFTKQLGLCCLELLSTFHRNNISLSKDRKLQLLVRTKKLSPTLSSFLSTPDSLQMKLRAWKGDNPLLRSVLWGTKDALEFRLIEMFICFFPLG